MGCIGMRLDDFCRCTPSEFTKVYEKWQEKETQKERGNWERVRMSCLCSLQPYSSKKLLAGDIMVFPWDGEDSDKDKCDSLSMEDRSARFAAAKKRYGID